MNAEDPLLPEVFSRIPRWAKLAVALPAIGLPLVILLFILRNEYAHDEQRCPYRPLVTQRLNAEIEIVEERRMCINGVEDRRYLAKRAESTRTLGTRRLPPHAFVTPGYRWTPRVENSQVFLKVVTPGHADAEFREGTDEERAY